MDSPPGGRRIVPNPQSCLRLATGLLKEYHEDWISGGRYPRMEPLSERRLKGEEEVEENEGGVRPAA